MPTAAQHRAEAGSLSRALETVSVVRNELVRESDDVGVRGGTALVVHWSLDASADDLDLLGRLVSAVVDELHRRAAACEQYTLAFDHYERAHRRWAVAVREYRTSSGSDRPGLWPGPEPQPPAVPFAGAVAG